MEENYNYVVVKSAWKAFTPLLTLLCVFILPIIIVVIRIILLKNDKTYFYDDKIVNKSGILSKHVRVTSFVGVSAIWYDQTLLGRIFRFGDVYIDVVGKWKISIKGVKKPADVKEFLEQYIVTQQDVTSVIHA